ncbi:DUF3467 domain-containing protein [Sphingobacteriaceae bacterium WQ 2009]|uniref:DUF3467 domain-containing protein n=1 Tax=Rhinopithecimicrobium faecis TaxID=2820698 RepID=A0A8T4HD10_9SPHI|nr:DUF3467 domain-containing protein [Sphingobacteriaceae bacterium WQ 2009]
MENTNLPENNELGIELSEEVAEGIYANLAIITHSTTEFVLDFVRVMPGLPKAKVKSRIIITPENAARLLGALQDNLQRYSAQIQAAAAAAAEEPAKNPEENSLGLTFTGPQGQA